MIPRDLGLALAPVALWLAVAAVNGRVAWWRAGVAGGLVFLASPLAGLFCALWFAALALVSRSRRAWPAAIAGAVVSAVWVVPLAISYHRYHGVVRIATLAPVTPTGAQAITGLGLALPLGAAGLALLRRRRTRGFAAVAVLAALPLAAVVLLATAPGESVVSHGMPPALVRWYRDLPFVVLALCVPAGVAADALMGLLARRARPFLEPAAATLVTFVCGSSVLASATVWREPYRTDVACSPLPLDAHTRVAVIAPEPAADYLSMTLFGRSGAGFYDVGQRSAKVRFRRWVGDHIPDLAARGTAVLGALDGGPLPTGVDLVFARPQQVRGLGRPVATCTWRGHRWELAPPAG